MKNNRALEIIRLLREEYPGEGSALNFSNNLELLVAVILSAQSTDKQINKITVDLFQKYRTVEDYARADREEFERDIRSSGFFRNKAKNIIGAARMIVDEFEGEIPRSMDELLRLPGVARKTANIVLYTGFGITSGIAVDTHVKRLSRRLGMTEESNPVKIERDLMELLPREHWGPVNFLLISHGRAVCRAKAPDCGECVLSSRCPSAAFL
ncbi:MAG: endonuclease III [Candidatus Auribacterota bacterium]|nr:endonuclease III [Candidatus Auribacterota bacterium]